jgi:predicted enzyme related to lactoylglutathione lyase
MPDPTGYPPGVPCWIDLTQPDVDATMAFYGGLFGWTFDVRTPPDAPATYAYARLDGSFVAAVAGPPGENEPAGWMSYVCVDSAEATAATVEANEGKVLTPPSDVGAVGTFAVCADPEGAVFGLWQPGENRGVETVNAPGSWNFSELHTADRDRAEAFYGAVFGWTSTPFYPDDPDSDRYWRLAGYGEFLAAKDPEVRAWQEASAGQVPEGFADAVAIEQTLTAQGDDTVPRWTVTFAVADADAAYLRAVELGATTVTPLTDTEYTRMSTVRDPQGAVLTLSEYRPPAGG